MIAHSLPNASIHATRLVATAAVTHHHAAPAIQYWQAIVLGLLQGVTELFPVSSLGHTVIFPALFGWHNVVAAESANESFWLAFVVGLHVGTALGLLVYYRRDWAKIIAAFFKTLGKRKAETPDERLAWLIIVATIPAGLTGVVLEHKLRVLFTKPLPASVFLMCNGVILLVGERYRRLAVDRAARKGRSGEVPAAAAAPSGAASAPAGARLAAAGTGESRALATLQYREAGVVGLAQVLALFAGISRSGVTMVAGLVRRLDHEDSARFAFLLATPIILLAGLYKLHDLLGSNGAGIRGQTLVGAGTAAIAALFSVRFLSRWFRTRTLLPFGVYCLLAGIAATIYFGWFS